MIFKFKTDTESQEYLEIIAKEMIRLFGISEEEAVGRINHHWHGEEIIGENNIIYHEEEGYWAKTIYYGKASSWWLNPPNLKPLPYHKGSLGDGES